MSTALRAVPKPKLKHSTAKGPFFGTLRVNVVDTRGSGMSGVVAALRFNNKMNAANPTVLVEFDPGALDRFDAFVVEVSEAVSMMERSISVLRLWGHAIVFDMKDEIPKGEAMLGGGSFSYKDVMARRSTLGHLRPFFSNHPNTRFEFRGCGVANNDGLAMMKELAALWGIRVHAAVLNQGTGMYWEGPVVEAMPDGTLNEIGGVPFNSAF